jgi:RNA polymerase primary sigma factor
MRSLEALSYEFEDDEFGLEQGDAPVHGPQLILIYGEGEDLAVAHIETPEPYDDDEFTEIETQTLIDPSLGRKWPRLSQDQETKLISKAKTGDDEAAGQVVIGNLGLAHTIAAQYNIKGIEFDDIVHNGLLGIYKAIEKFDPSRSKHFGGLARYYIKDAIFEGIYKTSRVVRLPANKYASWRDLAKVEDAFMQEHRRSPSLLELIEATGWDSNKISELRVMGKDIISLSAPLRRGSDLTVEDTLAGEFEEPGSALIDAEQRFLVKHILGMISARRAQVLEGYFGFDEGDSKTLEIIGSELGVTGKTAAQIRNEGLETLYPLAIKFGLDKR